MIKVGFIGFNKSAHRYHLPFIKAVDGFDLIGYYTRSNTKFEMSYPNIYDEVSYYDDPIALMKEVDLIIVVTPAMVHSKYVKLALDNDCHVLCDKPFVNTKDEASELFELAKSKNKQLFVYQNRRFDSDFISIFNNLDKVGKIYEIYSNHTYNRYDNLVNSSNKYDGFIYGHAVHFIDQIVSVYGRPLDVIYETRNIREDNKSVEDYYYIIMQYESMSCHLKFSPVSTYQSNRWEVHGNNGSLIKRNIDNQEEFLKDNKYPFNDGFGIDLDDIKFYHGDSIDNIKCDYLGYQTYYQNVVDVLNKGIDKLVSDSEVLMVLDIMEGIINE